MEVAEYHLKLTYDYGLEKEIIYRGNENLIIRSTQTESIEDEEKDKNTIIISRHILSKFLEMLE